MDHTGTSLFGIYHNRAQVERCISALLTAGLSNEDISVILADNHSSRTSHRVDCGEVLGGMLGFLHRFCIIAIPGLDYLIVAGPMAGELSGIGSRGSVGAVIGVLIGLGIPESEATSYDRAIKEGRVLLSVHCDGGTRVSCAIGLLRQTGARDISSIGEASAEYPAKSRFAN